MNPLKPIYFNDLGRIYRVVVVVCVATLTVGCAPKSRIATDPFRRQPAAPAIPGDPRYETGSVFDRANESARQRDIALDVQSSPVSDLPAASGGGDPFIPTSRANDPSVPDPFLNAASGTPAISAADPSAPNSTTGLAGSRYEQYELIRKRLDKVGAYNFHFDKDPQSNETLFSCELPYPDNASLFRVFEARSPDELKAMLAVTEQVEKWVAERTR